MFLITKWYRPHASLRFTASGPMILCAASLFTTAIMKTSPALPLQRPQKPPLTAHERLACSLGEREGARGEGRSTKGKGTFFQEKACTEARARSQWSGQPRSPPTLYTRYKPKWRFKGTTRSIFCISGLTWIEGSLCVNRSACECWCRLCCCTLDEYVTISVSDI